MRGLASVLVIALTVWFVIIKGTFDTGGLRPSAAAQPEGVPARLVFGKPTVLPVYKKTSKLVVQVTNPGSAAVSCFVKATFLKGEAVLGTSNGAVNKLAAKGTVTLELIVTDDIAGHDQVRLEPTTCF